VIRDSHSHQNFFWVWQDLWDSMSFDVKDFIPVQEGDVLRSDWKKWPFATNVWGKGELKSFLEVVKGEMAGQGRGRGRGREGRFDDDQWGGRGGGWRKISGEEPLPGGIMALHLVCSPHCRHNPSPSVWFLSKSTSQGFGQGQYPFPGQHQQ
jgi:hypothetical protein